jgi:UDP-GlcNAc:undecaprenyl-phosphate GlcNAc-1-phosphate transferase
MLLENFSPFLLAFILAVLITPIIRLAAIRQGWVARPRSDRWHKKTTALFGGVAIFVGIVIPTSMHVDYTSVVGISKGFDSITKTITPPLTLCIGCTILFFLGLLDDFKNLKPHTKLIGQIALASLVTFFGYRLYWFDSLTIDTMATLLWIVGITNAFNLIDNMDGLCAGVGLVASATLCILYYGINQECFTLSLILSGALGGFLIYNFNPAKIFMGDCGSLVIGFVLGFLALIYPEVSKSSPMASTSVPILLLMVPILDTTLVTSIRLLSGRKASTGGRDHTSHRLVLMGFSERSAVLFLYTIGAISGLSAVLVSRTDSMTSPMVIIPMFVATFLMGVYLSQLRVYPEKEFSTLRDKRFTPLLIELTYKRHLLMVLLDALLLSFAYYLSYRLRFEGHEFSYYFKFFLKSLPMVIGCKLCVFYSMGIYRGMWGYISTSDVFLNIRTSLVASFFSITILTLLYRFQGFSKGVFIIDCILATALLLTVRGSFRLFLEMQKRKGLAGDSVIIYGAGRGGELLLREILNNREYKVAPVGFIDDDPLKVGKKIQGYTILGSSGDLETLHKKHRFNGIIISFNQSNGSLSTQIDDLKTFCNRNGLFLKSFFVDLKDIATNV